MLPAFAALLGFAVQKEALISVDLAEPTPISPYIYGVNHPQWAGLGGGFTLARQGGNRMTAYNWETNASNAGNDFHHQNDAYLGETNEPGWTVRTFLQAAQSHGAAAILTVPTAGYVSADKNGDGDVGKTENYLETRFLKSYAHKPDGKFAYPPDTTDKAVYQDEFVAWIERIKSPKTPVWFSLDNEPDLWASTHARIWTSKPGYADIIANNIEFARAIKAVAPKALIFAPANYGWQGFRTFQDAPDAQGRDFLDTYLAAMKEYEKKEHKRLLEVLDIHWYPEARGDDVRIADNDGTKPGTNAARIQAPRSLWDKEYVEESWITKYSTQGRPIMLLPRVLEQIKKQYPGTKLAITEYNYGGGSHVSGMIAQADVLGIFGRYGLFAACNWGVSPRDAAIVAGFKAFVDYDGKGARFGDLGLKVEGESPSENSVYAAVDSKTPGRLTLVAINKTARPMPFRIRFKAFAPKKAEAFVRVDGHYEPRVATPVGTPGGIIVFQSPPLSVATIVAIR